MEGSGSVRPNNLRITVHRVHTAGGGKGYTLMFTLLTIEGGYPLTSIPAGSGKGYTLMFTLLTIEGDTLSRLSLQVVERDTPSCLHC